MISHTGIAGLTLGGGFGLLCRKFGLAIDNLISADIVTSDGKLRTVSATQEPDLFWAIRGGGGNFGIVTSFEYQLHEVGPMLAGLIAYPLPQALQVLRGLHEVMSSAPDELMVTGALLTTPEGHKAVAVVPCYAGDPAEGERVIAPLKKLGTVAMEKVGVMPYTVAQKLFDESAVPGRRFYLRSNYLETIGDALIETLRGVLRGDAVAADRDRHPERGRRREPRRARGDGLLSPPGALRDEHGELLARSVGGPGEPRVGADLVDGAHAASAAARLRERTAGRGRRSRA